MFVGWTYTKLAAMAKLFTSEHAMKTTTKAVSYTHLRAHET